MAAGRSLHRLPPGAVGLSAPAAVVCGLRGDGAQRAPDRYRQRLAAQVANPPRLEAGIRQPFRYLAAGKAEPPMGVVEAQRFEIVGGEIDDDKASAGPQQPC